jgi:hypothetical protein
VQLLQLMPTMHRCLQVQAVLQQDSDADAPTAGDGGADAAGADEAGASMGTSAGSSGLLRRKSSASDGGARSGAGGGKRWAGALAGGRGEGDPCPISAPD